MKKQVVTISREYGSGGREVAKLLSGKLGIPFYDGELLVIASEKYGIDLGMMKDYDEKRMGSVLYSIAMATSYASNFDKITQPYEIYEAQAKVMRQLVSEGPCIFLGRCAGEILKDETELLNVFIYSDDQHAKMERIIKVDGVTQGNAATQLYKKDVQRGNYYHYFSKKAWGDRNNYDLCLNTGKLGYEKVADILAAAVK